MNRPLFLLLCGLTVSFQSVVALDVSPWRFQQSVVVPAPGLVRLNLPVETLGAARSQLEDLRLLSPSGIETPFSIQRAASVPARVVPVKKFQLQLGDQATAIEIETGTAESITAVLLESPAPNFVKAALVEGSNDDQQWTPLATSEMVFRQPNGASRLRIPIASAAWKKLRVTLGDQRTAPVPFTAARVELATQQPSVITWHPVCPVPDQKPHEIQITVELGANHLQLVRVKLDVSDQVFSRRVRASYLQDDNGTKHEVTVASGVIYRFMDGDQSAASLEIPIEAQVNSSQLILTIENGDSPPLQVSNLEFTRLPVSVVFYAQNAGPWSLLAGNRNVPPPAYDLQALQLQLGKISAASLSPGPLIANADYKEPATLPGIAPEGAGLDLSPWHFRKQVTGAGPGVLRVELDAETLAHTQISLGDLRVIQDGKQIPFLTEATATGHSVQPALIIDPDPKRPPVSRWRVTLPISGLPAQRIVLTSPTPLFDRTLEVWSTEEDRSGGPYRMRLGSGRWIRNSGDVATDFSLSFSSSRLGGEFFIETENGDNSPIALEGARIEYPGVVVIAKIPQATPVFLYYGNEEAGSPHYDLQLARRELLSAPMANAPLGPEEKLRAETRHAAEGTAGSPWLWVALGLVLVVLLWVVAKMLPAPEEPKA